MKFTHIYLLVLGLFIFGISVVKAQTNDNEKLFYRMDRVKANNPWTTSLNLSGLIFNENKDFSVAELDFQYGKGDFRNVNASAAFNRVNLHTESFRRWNDVYFYGSFSFDHVNRLEMGWCSVIDPYRSPVFFADSTPGRQTLEAYQLEGGIGYAMGKHWTIGGKIDYTVASNAKKKDARNKNTYMNLKLYPGVMYRSKHVNVGANFIYQKETEGIEISTMGTGRTPEVLTVEGLWFYTSEQVLDTKFILRDIEDVATGGAVQLEFHLSRILFFHQFSVLKKKQEIFRSNTNRERGGEMEQRVYHYTGALNITGEKFNHYLNLIVGISNMLGFENIQQAEIIDQNSTWIQYGRKNKSSIASTTADASYNILRNRTRYNCSWNGVIGVKGFYVERYYRLFPAKFKQTLKNAEGYLSFNKNFLFEKGMLDCQLNGSYAIGGGRKLVMRVEAGAELSDVGDYKQREDVREHEFEYITSDKITSGVNVRYTLFLDKTQGTTFYAHGGMNYKRSTRGMFNGENRTTGEVTIGISF